MSWFNNLDNTEPTDLELVAEGAERFREFKRAIIERLSTAFADFPAEYSERPGERLLFPIAGAMVGTQAQRPDAPEREGHVWFSTDTNRMYIGDADLSWQLLGGAVPQLSAATYVYNNFPGTKVANVNTVGRIYGLKIFGSTDAGSSFQVHGDEFDPELNIDITTTIMVITSTLTDVGAAVVSVGSGVINVILLDHAGALLGADQPFSVHAILITAEFVDEDAYVGY